MIDIEQEKQARWLVLLSMELLEKADRLHGQPLFFDKDGNFVEVVEVLRETAKGLRDGIIEEGGTP